MVIIGAVTIATLPVALFPNIVPPEVQSPRHVCRRRRPNIEQSVATPIEQQMSGVDNMNYMYSLNSTADGGMRLIVDYDVKTDPNTDLILTQMRSTQAQSQLPADVNNFGLTVQKTVTAPLDAHHPLFSQRHLRRTVPLQFRLHQSERSNYSPLRYRQRSNLRRRPIRHAPLGQPDQLAKLAITVPEIVSAIQAQNTVNPAGQVGSEPVPKGQEFTYSVRARGRLSSRKSSVRSSCGRLP